MLQLVMRAMDRRARECEAASLLLAALHPKLIDPQQVGPLLPEPTFQKHGTHACRHAEHGTTKFLLVDMPSAFLSSAGHEERHCEAALSDQRELSTLARLVGWATLGCCVLQAAQGFTRLLAAAEDAALDTPAAAHLLVRPLFCRCVNALQ